MSKTEKAAAQIEVLGATPEQQPILANLLELYAHDFSEFHDVSLGPDGRFGYRDLPLYWSDPERHPFLAKVDGSLAGLVLVKRGPRVSVDEMVWDMAEFFVVRACRRRGLGTEIAQQVFRMFPGVWEVRVMEANDSAHHFWEHAIAEFSGRTIPSVPFDKGGKRWRLFSFESPGGAS